MREMMKAWFLATLSVLLLPTPPVCDGRRLGASEPLVLHGKVYCDTCRAGFETYATTYMPGAKVRVECIDMETQKTLFSKEAITDSSGMYKIVIEEDHMNQLCDVKLISSPHDDCATPDPGRDSARVSLTTNNGMATNDRVANSLGFFRDQALRGCDKILEKYLEPDDYLDY